MNVSVSHLLIFQSLYYCELRTVNPYYSTGEKPSLLAQLCNLCRRSVLLPHYPHTFPSFLPLLIQIPPGMASTIASRRLFHEYKLLTSSPPDGITAGPVSEDDIFLWEALIQGPDGTPFEGGIFPAELKFPKDYPLNPPTMRFLGEVWHPNGNICPRAPSTIPGRDGSLRLESLKG